jgi:hypothetical protein
MEVLRPQIIEGEQIYAITAIGVETVEAEQIRQDAGNLHGQEYVRQYEERQQTIGQNVDMQL